MTAKSFKDLEKQAAAILGFKPESIGKTQARQEFLPLVAALNQTGAAVEITDHEKPVAVLVSYNHWLALMSKLAMLSKKDRLVQPINLIGSVQVIGDLEKASKKAAHRFAQSIKDTTKKL